MTMRFSSWEDLVCSWTTARFSSSQIKKAGRRYYQFPIHPYSFDKLKFYLTQLLSLRKATSPMQRLDEDSRPLFPQLLSVRKAAIPT